MDEYAYVDLTFLVANSVARLAKGICIVGLKNSLSVLTHTLIYNYEKILKRSRGVNNFIFGILNENFRREWGNPSPLSIMPYKYST